MGRYVGTVIPILVVHPYNSSTPQVDHEKQRYIQPIIAVHPMRKQWFINDSMCHYQWCGRGGVTPLVQYRPIGFEILGRYPIDTEILGRYPIDSEKF